MFYRSSVLFKKKHTYVPTNAGFSMIELLVSIGIIVLVLSIAVTRQQSFNASVLLRSQAYDIALTMRELQLGAISSASDGSGVFRSVQGVYFDEANNQQYRLFRDSTSGSDSNNFWDAGEDIGFSGLLDPRFEIRDISIGTELSIVFQRPNFDAVFVTDGNDNAGSISNATSVLLTIGLRGGSGTACGQDIRQIQVTSAGQISVLEC